MRQQASHVRSRHRSQLAVSAVCLLRLGAVGCRPRGRTAAVAEFHLARKTAYGHYLAARESARHRDDAGAQ